MSTKKSEKKLSMDSSKIEIDDAGRIKELDESILERVVGGQRGEICRIQTDSRGCGMNM